VSTNGKSTSKQKSLNYYGTIAGALSWGPWDWLTAVVSNGNYIWQCGASPLDLTPGAGHVNGDGYVDLTGGVLDHTLFMEGGYLRFYPGTSDGNPDPALVGHPAYRDTAVVVAKHLFFGQNSGTAPNLQLIGGRCPRVPTTIVAAEDNIVDDRQVNPVAAVAEFLLDERGASMLEAQLDAASWLAAAHWCAQDAAHRHYSFCSPLFTEQVAVREVVKSLLDPVCGFLRWTAAGKLGCYIYEWGVDPGGLVTLDARHFTKPPKFVDGDWKDIATEFTVRFTDRAYEWQENSVRVPNQRAADLRNLDDAVDLDRKHITRAAQAQAHGVEYMRRMALAPGTATLTVRGPVVAGLRPGDKIKVDTDPEPGGSGLAQLARIDKIEGDRTDETTLAITLDPLLPATSYTPTWVSPLPETLFAGAVESAPSLVHLLALPLPPAYFDWPPAVGFVATRPSARLAGFRAFFATDPDLAFAELGAQVGFAARAQLVSSVSDAAGTLRLQLLDGAAGPEAYLAAATPGGNAAEAEDNTLLAILVSLDGEGRVDIDGEGRPIMEFVSILERSAVTSDTHDYTVYRERCSLEARAWAASTAVWIVPRANLQPWRHELFSALLGLPAYFRLAAFTSAAVDETIPLPESDLVFPPIYGADLPASYSIILSAETMAVACGSDGTPTAGQLGSGGVVRTTVGVLRAGVPLTAVGSAPGLDQFSVSIGTLDHATATKESNTTVRADTLTAASGSILIDVHVGGAFVIAKKFTITKAKDGTNGTNGTNGADGEPGEDGGVGPGLVYRGDYDAGKHYYFNASRRDVVKYSGSYKLANNAAKDGLTTWGAPSGSDWTSFGAEFESVATKLLLAEDAAILHTLVMGDGATADAGIIRSNGAPAFDTGSGFWLGHEGTTAKFRVGNPSGPHLSFDGSDIELASPRITGGGIYITSVVGLRYVDDDHVFTITGGSDNGSSHGAQIDLAGNGLGDGAGGVLVLSAGDVETGDIRFRTANTERGKVRRDGKLDMTEGFVTSGTLDVGGTASFGADLVGAGTGTSTIKKAKIETNPDDADHCFLGCKISTDSDGGSYIEMDVNGGSSVFIKIISVLP